MTIPTDLEKKQVSNVDYERGDSADAERVVKEEGLGGVNKQNAQALDAEINPSTRYLEGIHLAIVIICLYFATFLAAIDTSMITASVPKITTDLHSLDSVSWISAGYTLTMTAFQPAFGKLYRFFKVEAVYITSIILFEIGSVLCASAHNGVQFIFGRAIAGLGAAGLTQGALCIITHTVKYEKRPLYNGIVTSVFGVAICFGPIMGGALTNKASWRWCFWINLPIGAACLIAILVFLRVTVPKDSLRLLSIKDKMKRIDIFGTAVFVGAICCILLALQFGGQIHPWNSPTIIVLFVCGGVSLIVFVFLQWKRGEDALLPLRILSQRSICAGFISLGLLGSANVVVCFYVPFYFQAVQGVDAMGSGIRFVAYFLPLMVAIAVTGALVSKWGYYVQPMLFGEFVMIAGCVCLMRLEVRTKAVEWAGFLVMTGIGMGIAQQLPYTAVQVALSDDDIPAGNAVILFSWLMGGAISVAIGQNICLSTIRSELPKHTTEISPETAIKIGAYGLQGLNISPAALEALRESWRIAVTRTFIFSVAAISAAVPITSCMQWKNSRREGKRRREEKESHAELNTSS